jgi:cell division protein FtsB
MIEKIKNLLAKPVIQQFKDIRVVGFAVFGIIVLLVTWSGVGVIETNYELQKKVSKVQQENQVAELANNNLRLQNQYYGTDQYLELQARKQFGKGLPGEKLILVPKSVALAHTIDAAQAPAVGAQRPKTRKPAYQRNFESWRNFFTHGRAVAR